MSKKPTAFISKIGLSDNPEAKFVEHPDGFPKDGKKVLNVTSDGAPYFVITVEDDSNPLQVRKTVLTSRMNKNNKGEWTWRSWKPAKMTAAMKTTKLFVPGAFVTRDIEPTVINVTDNEGNPVEREITSSTVFVSAGTTVAAAFKARGFTLVTNSSEEEHQENGIVMAGGFGMGDE